MSYASILCHLFNVQFSLVLLNIHTQYVIIVSLLQVLCWGVRDMKKYHFTSVNSPFVKIECEDLIKETKGITSAKKNPNFSCPAIIMDVVCHINMK